MYNDLENIPADYVTAKSLDECRAILFEKFGNSYQITDIKTDLKGGFLGLFPKEYVKVKYIIRNKAPSYTDSAGTFEKNKDELLKTLNPSVNTTKQIAALDKKLDQLSSLLENKFDDIKSNSEQLHKNIVRISEMLEENEFTKEYIKDICDRLRSEFSLEELEDFDRVEKQVVDWIGE